MLQKLKLFIGTHKVPFIISISCIVSSVIFVQYSIYLQNLQFTKGLSFEESVLDHGIKEVVFSFDKPIIPFKSYQETEQLWLSKLNLQFDPPAQGHIRTISAKSFVYVFQTPVTNTVTVSFSTNILSLNNDKSMLSINHIPVSNNSFTLTPETPRVVFLSKLDDYFSNTIQIELSQPVSSSVLKKAVSIKDNKKKYSFKIIPNITTNQFTDIQTISTNYKKYSIDIFGLKPNTSFSIFVDESQFSPSNSSVYSQELQTHPLLEWIGLSSEPQYDIMPLVSETQNPQSNSFPIENILQLRSTTPLCANNQSTLQISPIVENLEYNSKPYGIEIKGLFKADQEYHITFSPKNLKDIYGQKIKTQFITNLIFTHKKPFLAYPEKEALISRKNPKILLQSVNTTNVTLTYQIIRSSYYAALSLYGKSVPVPTYTTNFQLNTPIDQLTWTEFDLSSIMSNQSGLILLNFENKDIPNNGKKEFTHIFYSDSTLLAHASARDLLFSARNIYTEDPIEGMMISIWDHTRGSYQDLGRTSSEGLLRVPNHKLPIATLKNPIFIGVLDEDITFTGNEGLFFNKKPNPVYQSANIIPNHITEIPLERSMIFTDRPIYEPGESVHIHAIARIRNDNKLTTKGEFFNTPVSITIKDPLGNTYTNISKTWDAYGTVDLKISLPKTAASGYYTIISKSSYHNFYHTASFQVSIIDPKIAKITLKTDKNIYFYGDTLKLYLNSKYLSGQLINAPISYYINLFPTPFYSEMYPEYTFQNLTDPNTQNSTNIILKNSILKNRNPIKTRLYQVLSQNAHIKIHAEINLPDTGLITKDIDNIKVSYPYQAGLYINKISAALGETVTIKGIILNTYTDTVAVDQKAVLEIKKLITPKLGIFSFVTNFIAIAPLQKTVYSKSMILGQENIDFTAKEEGTYIISLTHKNAPKTSLSFTIGAEISSYIIQENNDKILMRADKALYQSGDRATILIENPYPNSRLMIVSERDNSIRSIDIIESTNKVISYPIALTQEDEPGINLSAYLVNIIDQGTPTDRNYLAGNLSIPVQPLSKKIHISITTDKENYSPQENVTLIINGQNSQGLPIDGKAVVIVRDKGAFTKDNIPDPIEEFYQIRPSSFSMWDSSIIFHYLKDITNKNFPKNMYQPRTLMASDWTSMPSEIRSNIQYTVFYDVITLSKNKATEVIFRLPDNLTELDISVIAYDRKNLLGKKNKSITVSKSMFTSPQLPFFVRPKDFFTWKTYIYNFTDEAQNTAIHIECPNKKIQTNTLVPANSTENIVIPTSIPTTNNDKLLWLIKSETEKYKDTFIREIPVISSNPWETSSYTGILSNKITHIPINFESNDNILSQKMTINISPSPITTVQPLIAKIIENQSSYLPRRIQRINTIAGNEDLITRLVPYNKKQLQNIVNKDISDLSSYFSTNYILGSIPRKNPVKDDPILILSLYETLLQASRNRYTINKDIITNLSNKVVQYSQQKNISQPYYAWAVKLSVENKTLSAESFQQIYPLVEETIENYAFIIESLGILGGTIKEFSGLIPKLLSKNTETANTIVFPSSSNKAKAQIASAMIKYYGTTEYALKILQGLPKDCIDMIPAYLAFTKKYPDIKHNTHVEVYFNKKLVLNSKEKNSITIPMVSGQNYPPLQFIKAKGDSIFYSIAYSSISESIPPSLNAGFDIIKKYYTIENKLVEELENNTEYIVELTLTPTRNIPELVEIIDPILGGIEILDTKISGNTTINKSLDKVHIFTKASATTKIRYHIKTKIQGTWTVPPIEVLKLNDSETYGYRSQPSVVIK